MWHTLRELQPPKEIKMRENETTSWELRHLVTTFNLFQLPLVSQHYPSLRHLVYKVRKLSHNSKYFHAHHGIHYLLLHPILEHRLPLVHLEWSGQHTIFFFITIVAQAFLQSFFRLHQRNLLDEYHRILFYDRITHWFYIFAGKLALILWCLDDLLT